MCFKCYQNHISSDYYNSNDTDWTDAQFQKVNMFRSS